MGVEGDKSKYSHLKNLIAGNHKSGNSVRDELIVSDAKKHMADLIKKRPNIDFDGSKAIEKAKAEKEAKKKAEAEAKAKKEAEAKGQQ